MTTTDGWHMPSLDTVYQIEGQEPMTLGQMLEGISPDLIPTNEVMFQDLLCAFGAWESVEEMNAALTTCEGRREGLRLI